MAEGPKPSLEPVAEGVLSQSRGSLSCSPMLRLSPPIPFVPSLHPPGPVQTPLEPKGAPEVHDAAGRSVMHWLSAAGPLPRADVPFPRPDLAVPG